MIKCKQAMESSACGKVCCCLECEERESCKDVCTELSPDCEDAFSEETAKEILMDDEITVQVALNSGSATAKAWGCDLTYDYVKINGDYRT